MPRIDLKPRKQARQQRSLAMVELILEAATRVLTRDSLAGFNTNRVAEVAGISVGSLYQYFPNKAALVAALIDRAQTELAQVLEDTVASIVGQPLDEALAAVARLAIAHQYANPVLATALDHEEQRLPLQPRLRAAEQRLLASVQTLLDRHRAELAPALPTAAARDCLVICKALVEADAGAARRPPADLEARVLRALLGYLTR